MFKLAQSSNNKMIYVNVLPLDFNMFISQVLEAGPPKNEDLCWAGPFHSEQKYFFNW